MWEGFQLTIPKTFPCIFTLSRGFPTVFLWTVFGVESLPFVLNILCQRAYELSEHAS